MVGFSFAVWPPFRDVPPLEIFFSNFKKEEENSTNSEAESDTELERLKFSKSAFRKTLSHENEPVDNEVLEYLLEVVRLFALLDAHLLPAALFLR